jgi:LmbE family N-acetylglucosaminyl deacetylase
MALLSDHEVERVLIVVAHPDDADFGASGTTAAWTDAGIAVSYCIVTDGDAGGFDDATPRHVMAEIRRAEQTAAAACVGVTDLHFLRFPDGRVESTLELRRAIARVIREVRPRRVITHSPDRDHARMFVSHPDHLAVGEATLCAVYPDARNPYAFPELVEQGHPPWTVDEVYLLAAATPDRSIDITDTFDRKVAALRAHASQMQDPDGLEDRLRSWGAGIAAAAGLEPGRLAEGYLRIDTNPW